MRFLTITRTDGTTVTGRLLGAGNGSDHGLDLIVRDEITDEVHTVNTLDVRCFVYDPDTCADCGDIVSGEDLATGNARRTGAEYHCADCGQDRDMDARERAHDDVLAAMDAGH